MTARCPLLALLMLSIMRAMKMWKAFLNGTIMYVSLIVVCYPPPVKQSVASFDTFIVLNCFLNVCIYISVHYFFNTSSVYAAYTSLPPNNCLHYRLTSIQPFFVVIIQSIKTVYWAETSRHVYSTVIVNIMPASGINTLFETPYVWHRRNPYKRGLKRCNIQWISASLMKVVYARSVFFISFQDCVWTSLEYEYECSL